MHLKNKSSYLTFQKVHYTNTHNKIPNKKGN